MHEGDQSCLHCEQLQSLLLNMAGVDCGVCRREDVVLNLQCMLLRR